MKKYAVINGKILFFIYAFCMADAKLIATDYADHSETILIREINQIINQ